MKMTARQWITKASAVLVLVVLCGCYDSPSEQQFNHATALLKDGQVEDAEKEFEKIFEESADKTLVLESAVQLYEISFFRTKNYPKALRYLEILIANSASFADSLDALKKKALIEHKNISNYEAAIVSYGRLLSNTSLSMAEENEFRLNLVKCLFAINKFEQAKSELKPLLEASRPNSVRFTAKNLEASIHQAEGQVDKAIEAFEAALLFASSDDEKQDVLMDIALCYEQKEQYSKALDALNRVQVAGPFLTEKKKQLERLAKFKNRRLNR